MTAERELLEQARAAGAQLAEAERQVLLSRAEYHTAIRRVHLAGRSMREIAQALSLSHQRVQQIVHDAGGTWWRRVWRMRKARPDAVCTWCQRPPSEVSKLIAGPAVFICDACVEAAERAATSGDGPSSTLKRSSGGTMRPCAFCRKRGSATRPLIVGPARICGDCLKACREILDARAG